MWWFRVTHKKPLSLCQELEQKARKETGEVGRRVRRKGKVISMAGMWQASSYRQLEFRLISEVKYLDNDDRVTLVTAKEDMFYSERVSYNESNYIIGKQTKQMRWRISTWKKKYKWQKKPLKTYSNLLIIKDMKMKIKYNFHISNTRYQKTERMFDVSESVVTWAQPYAVIGSMSRKAKHFTLGIYLKSLKAPVFLAQRVLPRNYLILKG